MSHLRQKGNDYSSNAVVFPGRRPAHYLRKTLADHIGKSFIPPVIFSIDDFVDFVYEGKSSDRKLLPIDAVALLYDLHKQSSKPIGGKSFLSPDSFFPLGLKIFRDIEELYIEGVPARQVRELESFSQELIPEQTAKRIQSISFFYESFYKRIQKIRYSTRSLRYRMVAEKIQEVNFDCFQTMIFAGFFAFTTSERDMFRNLLSRDNSLFIFQQGKGLEENLSPLGIHFEKTGEAAKPRISLYSSPDTHGQVFALNKLLEQENGSLDENTVIVLPSSETLFPLLRQSLSTLEEGSYNVSMGYPIVRTPIFGFLNNLMELITNVDEDRFYIPDYLAFILHPYTKNIYFDRKPEVSRIIFHTIEDYFTQMRTKTFTTLEEIENNDDLLRKIMERIPIDESVITQDQIVQHLRDIHNSTIRHFLLFQDVSDCSRKCMDVLLYIYNNSTARLHPLFYPFSESFIQSLDSISRSLMKDMRFSETSHYFAFLRQYLMTSHAPFEGVPVRGLQVLGFLETRNIKFDRVFVLDVNEEIIPDTRKEDTLLPHKVREILHLPTFLDRDRLIAYYFDILVKGAQEVHLLFIEDDNKERSRFVEKYLWDRQKKEKDSNVRNYIQSVQYKVRLDNSTPSGITKNKDIVTFLRDFAFSATAVDTYLNCQLQFYYRYVLNLGKKEDFSGDIERTDIGKFVHTVLSEFFSHKKNHVLKPAHLSVKSLHRLTDNLFTEHYGESISGALYLLKKQIKDHLKDLLQNYYIPLAKRESFMVLGTEQSIRLRKNSFLLKGRLDCIEKRSDKTFIVDYKTGSGAESLRIRFDRLDPEKRETWEDAIGSVQLPFYLMLYNQKTGTPLQDLQGMFLLIGQSAITEKIEHRLFDNGNQGEIFAILERIIFRLLGEIVDPSVPFMPVRDTKGTCPFCDYQYICGTQWIEQPFSFA